MALIQAQYSKMNCGTCRTAADISTNRVFRCGLIRAISTAVSAEVVDRHFVAAVEGNCFCIKMKRDIIGCVCLKHGQSKRFHPRLDRLPRYAFCKAAARALICIRGEKMEADVAGSFCSLVVLLEELL